MQQVATVVGNFFRGVQARRLEDVSAIQVDQSVRRYLHRHGLQSALVGYRGYPAYCSVSTNEVAIHGLPDERRLCRGDVFSLDIAASGGGWFTDMAWSFLMPGSSRRAEDEYRRAWLSFRELLSGIDADMSLRDLAVTAEHAAEKRGLSPIPEFTGHGIGRQLHEAPIVPFTSSALSRSENGSRIRLLPGTVINVEPVYRPQAGAELGIVKDENGWSYRTADGARTYHFEVTIVMEEKGASVLQFNGKNTRRLPETAPFGEVTGVRAGVGWKD